MKTKIITLFLFLLLYQSFAQTFTLKSDSLGGQATDIQLLNGFGCKGKNQSPHLYWENPPKNTQSFAVTIYDENAPTGSGWWHWLIFDINKDTLELLSDSGDINKTIAPKNSIQSKTDFNVQGYGGPCPPMGDKAHRYVITLYALKIEKLGLDSEANPALVGYYLEQNSIKKASLMFYYQR